MRSGVILPASATVVAPAAAVASSPAGGAADGCPPPLGPVTVPPTDVRYQELVRGRNKRYVASPEYVRVVGSTKQVVQAVHDAVRTRKRVVVVRSGGHCLQPVRRPLVHPVLQGQLPPRLQRVKARYDPLDVFHHALAVRPV